MQKLSLQFPETAHAFKTMYHETLYLGVFLLPTTRKPVF